MSAVVMHNLFMLFFSIYLYFFSFIVFGWKDHWKWFLGAIAITLVIGGFFRITVALIALLF